MTSKFFDVSAARSHYAERRAWLNQQRNDRASTEVPDIEDAEVSLQAHPKTEQTQTEPRTWLEEGRPFASKCLAADTPFEFRFRQHSDHSAEDSGLRSPSSRSPDIAEGSDGSIDRIPAHRLGDTPAGPVRLK